MLTAAVAPARATLIYDGDCAFCREWADRIRRRDAAGRIDLVPFQDGARVASFGIPVSALRGAMHLVLPDGRVFAGARAAPEIFKQLPGTRWLAAPFMVPGVLWAAERVYRWIARRRHRLGSGCGSGACRRGD